MPRRVFFSFHFTPDNWRACQVRNIGAIEGNSPASDNDWEQIKKSGDSAIQRWIDGQLSGRVCTIVLIGEATAGRRWIKYEVEKSWNDGKGVLGIHIHRLKDRYGLQARMGPNPFETFTMERDGSRLSEHIRTYDPPYWESTQAYAYIQYNLTEWIEEAIAIRSAY